MLLIIYQASQTFTQFSRHVVEQQILIKSQWKKFTPTAAAIGKRRAGKVTQAATSKN